MGETKLLDLFLEQPTQWWETNEFLSLNSLYQVKDKWHTGNNNKSWANSSILTINCNACMLKMSFYEVPRFAEKYLIQSTDPKTTKLWVWRQQAAEVIRSKGWCFYCTETEGFLLITHSPSEFENTDLNLSKISALEPTGIVCLARYYPQPQHINVQHSCNKVV